ncbi:MAG: type II toxin-antitoxin system VapB family antitoxin [Microcystaceae cyanobacterium]
MISEQLIAKALEATGLKTPDEVIELGLYTLIHLKTHQKDKSQEKQKIEENNQPTIDQAGLHLGAISIRDDFDEPLDDSFWLGEK